MMNQADPCYSMALRLLGRRAYSSHRLKEKLLTYFAEQDVDTCIEKLKEKKYLDDVSYLHFQWEKGQKQGLSHQMRIKKLAREGFNSRDLKETFEENVESEDEVANALEYLHHRKKNLLAKLNDPKTKERLYRHLIYKGFSSSVLSKVWKELEPLRN